MASADTEAEAKEAWAKGWRTFRVRKGSQDALIKGQEIICPASDEGGKRAELGAYILNEKGFTAYVLKR